MPTPFDALKELNAHAGRVATLLGLLLAATSLSLANGPVHDAVVLFNPSAHGFMYGLLIVLGFTLYGGVLGVTAAMNNALPMAMDDEQQWTELVVRKRLQVSQALWITWASVSALMAVWVVAYVDITQRLPSTSNDAGTAAMILVPVVASWCGWQYKRIARWLALLDRLKRP